jgi:Trk K+ transport system NAD-binding subunit
MLESDKSPPPPVVIVCGLGRFGVKLAELLQAKGAEVWVISDETTHAERVSLTQSMGLKFIQKNFLDESVWTSIPLEKATAVIFATANDTANLQAALELRAASRDVRIVLRMEAPHLSQRLREDFSIDEVLCPAALSAQTFAEVAERQQAPQGLPLGPSLALNARQNGVIILAWLVAALFVSGVVVFHFGKQLSWLNAVYFTSTLMTSVGLGDIHLLESPAWVKLFGILVMFGGVSLLAVAVSVVSNFLMSGAALQLQAQRAARRLRGHVIVVGVGSVGTAVVRALCAKGVPTVVVDAKADSDDFRAVQDICPTIVGDAKRPEVLVRAGIHHAKCLLAVTSLDAANLEIALVAKEVAKETRPDHRLPVVLRCFDMAMARRINAVSGDYHVLSSAQIAAPVFVEKALMPR